MLSNRKDQLSDKLNELHNRTLALLNKLAAYSDEDLNRQPRSDVWSVNQVLTHLVLSERLSMQYVRKKLSFKPTLKRSYFVSQTRFLLLRISLALPLKFRAPKAVRSDDRLESYSLSDLRIKWLADRDDLGAYLLNLNEELLDLQVYKHPFAGRLSLLQMIDFFINHLSRHEGQIDRRLP
ncbi:MAG: DinB family protein [Saprospiraceae bacterium]|nr:DinB family protein [Saprospiraceae bacterium]